ncbi:phenol hydroxylase subunit [Rhodoferax sp.]|uniref:phenol hydroxylase subunit n=1 Tax=Rhodoferax sp. TaxID=50421 RepID=UPI0034537588
MNMTFAPSTAPTSGTNAPCNGSQEFSPVPAAADGLRCDVTRKFVRIKQVRADGLVCFEFAIGWPELFVDLMLPQAAFDDFCVQQHVQRLSD